jgi:CRP-like cAMP-binding protein
MTPASDDDAALDDVVSVDQLSNTPAPLVGQMASLRHAARAQPRTPTPRTTQRMHEAPRRFTGPLLTPTPLPAPLALHDTDDDSVSTSNPLGAVRRSSAPLSLSPAAVRTDAVLRDRPHGLAAGGYDPDEDAMTRIADEVMPPPLEEPSEVRASEVSEVEEVVADDLISEYIPDLIDDDIEFDGPTSSLSDDLMTTIAPELPPEFRAAGGEDDEAMTMIADESGLLPRKPKPPARKRAPGAPPEPRGGTPAEPPISPSRLRSASRSMDPEVFDRATRPILGALDLIAPRDRRADFDDLPTPPPEPLSLGFDEEPPARASTESEVGASVDLIDDGLFTQVADASRETVDLPPDAFAAADDFSDQTTDHNEETNVGASASREIPVPAALAAVVRAASTGDEDVETNPGLDTHVRPTPLAPAGRDSANDLELDRAFDKGFSDTIQRLTPDGAVIDVPLQLFAALPEDALAEMGRRMSLRHYDAGARIVSEGEAGNACFVIAHGEVRVLKRDPLHPGGALIEVARLGNGALFGEFALLADRRRHATVEAVSSSEIYEIPRRLLRELAVNYPGVGPALERFYRERLLSTLLWTAPFFKPLAEERRGPMLEKFKPFRAESGEKIVKEGEPAGGLFLIVLGSVEITKRVGERRSVLLATLGEGAYFGEMSLLRGAVANASVIAVGPTELAVMSPRDFYEVVAENPRLWDEVRREANRRQLENHQIVTGDTNVV